MGDAVNQVGRTSRATGQKPIGVKRRGTTTVPPDARVDSADATNPWTWNKGITQSDTSSGPSW